MVEENKKNGNNMEKYEWLIKLVEMYYHGELPKQLKENIEKNNVIPLVEEAINICVEKRWNHELYDIAIGKYELPQEIKDKAGLELVKIILSKGSRKNLIEIMENKKIGESVRKFAEEMLYKLEKEERKDTMIMKSKKYEHVKEKEKRKAK